MTCDNTIYTPPKKKGGDENLAKLIDKSIESIEIPEGVQAIGSGVFSNCKSLSNVLPSHSLKSVGQNSFKGCVSLQGIVFHEGVEIIDQVAFDACSGLTYVDLPNSLVSVKLSAFRACTSLQSISIGTGIQEIGDYAFYQCEALISVTVKAINPPTISTNTFREVPNNCAIYVPAQSVSAYKTAQYWSARADHIQAIQE